MFTVLSDGRGMPAITFFILSPALLNKSNFCPVRGSDHSPYVNIPTFRSPAKVQHHQLEGLQQRPYHSGFTHFLGG
ncbi:hypothetical protein [Serratia symbiotica]|uniref:hypothetical protein n=1 Tax=Serratia symbiotica TaxID=138074 RepID=UPI0030D264E1